MRGGQLQIGATRTALFLARDGVASATDSGLDYKFPVSGAQYAERLATADDERGGDHPRRRRLANGYCDAARQAWTQCEHQARLCSTGGFKRKSGVPTCR